MSSGGDPKAQELRTPSLRSREGMGGVARDLGRGGALLVEVPPVGDHVFVRGLVLDSYRHKQRAVEPSTVLVGAFEIDIGGTPIFSPLHQTIFSREKCEVGGAGIEPNNQKVVFFSPPCSPPRATFSTRPHFT